ncbi:MAG: trypsin-like peptidase domain-containing protein [Nanoarchaeota archaeon]|nr:trypsin-like peptidase domain-containing protein [Nanoarchaeota archaeon]
MKKEKSHKHHIKHLKRHRNVLYGVVVILLILQIVSFVVISSQASRIIADQQKIRGDLNKYVDEVRQENRVSINEIIKIIAEQGSSFEEELELLKASKVDFSDVIEDVIKEVVNIRTDKSAATGFIVNSAGYIVTNLHVVQGAKFVNVQTFDGRIYDAIIVGEDSFTDLSLLKITGVFDYIELEDSDNVQIGEKVIAIGNPLGLSFTVTEGIVSAVGRRGPNGLEVYIQTDVTLNPGNSGGPLINKKGKVIGINNFKIGGAESLGFALESNVVREEINIIANKTIIG